MSEVLVHEDEPWDESHNTDAEEVSSMISRDAAAVVFHSDGSVSLLLPDDIDGDEVGSHVLAATEVLFASLDRVHELAEAFKTRTQNESN